MLCATLGSAGPGGWMHLTCFEVRGPAHTTHMTVGQPRRRWAGMRGQAASSRHARHLTFGLRPGKTPDSHSWSSFPSCHAAASARAHAVKLDPVFLLEPVPAPKMVPTRRAFLLAGVAGIAGIGVGFGSGFWAGRSQAGSASEVPIEAERRIAWARSLAEQAPVSELLDNLPGFLGVVHEAYEYGKDDAILWQGVQRAASALIENESVEQRGAKARALLLIFKLRPTSALGELRPLLARIAMR